MFRLKWHIDICWVRRQCEEKPLLSCSWVSVSNFICLHANLGLRSSNEALNVCCRMFWNVSSYKIHMIVCHFDDINIISEAVRLPQCRPVNTGECEGQYSGGSKHLVFERLNTNTYRVKQKCSFDIQTVKHHVTEVYVGERKKGRKEREGNTNLHAKIQINATTVAKTWLCFDHSPC